MEPTKDPENKDQLNAGDGQPGATQPEPTTPAAKKRVPFDELPSYAQKGLRELDKLKTDAARIAEERGEAEKAARISKLESEKRYEEALAQRDADYEAKLKMRDRENAKDKLLAKLQIAGYSEGQAELYSKGYDGGNEDGTPDEYLERVIEKAPLPEPTDPRKPAAPTKTSPGPINGKLTKTQLRELETSDDPAKRMEAIGLKEQLMAKNYDETGEWKLPELE